MSTPTLTHTLNLTRVFNAPKDLLFQMFTQVEHLQRWFCPLGWRVCEAAADAQEGGSWRVKMTYADGDSLVMKGVYRELIRPDKVVFTHMWEDGHPTPGIETLVTVTLAESAGQTTMTFVQEGFLDEEARDAHGQGWSDAFVNLEARIEEAEDDSAGFSFRIERTFDAPRQMVWDAWTQPEALEKWFGPAGCSVRNVTADIREGGGYHYGMELPNGMAVYGKWIYRRLVEPKYMCLIFGFADAEGNYAGSPMMEVWPRLHRSELLFLDLGEKTLLVMRSTPIHATEAEITAFEGMRDSMMTGWTGTLDKLMNYLKDQTA